MNIIFLDVDGCLNSLRTKDRVVIDGIKYIGVENRFVRRLGWVVEKTGAKIVLTSDWGMEGPHSEHMIYLKQKLSAYGVKIYDTIDWHHFRRNMRGYAIFDWLENHPDVDKYIVIDDTYFWAYNEPFIAHHLFYCFDDETNDDLPNKFLGITSNMRKAMVNFFLEDKPLSQSYIDPDLQKWYKNK